jgi:hypothetical protein
LADDLSDLFVALGEAAKDPRRGVVFPLDEIQFLDRGELEALIAALRGALGARAPRRDSGAPNWTCSHCARVSRGRRIACWWRANDLPLSCQ